MKTRLICILILLSIGLIRPKNIFGQGITDYINAFTDTLTQLSAKSGNSFFKLHCESMIDVIEAKTSYTSADSSFIMQTYNAFNNESVDGNAKKLTSYLNRQRPFILSWVSPTDGQVSFSWLVPPVNWDPDGEYPLYIQLHGLWSVASNTIEYMTYPFLEDPSSGFAFEDGYLLSPWGRGNQWYLGISETDIWECTDALEEIVNIDPSRKYLSGHSMGGYGAWHIALSSPNTWAAIGVHAGSLWYDSDEVTASAVAKLKDVPVYFVCGTSDGNLSYLQQTYQLLQNAGNPDLDFVTFTGGHVYIEENVQNMYLWMRNFTNDDWYLSPVTETIHPAQFNKITAFPNPFTSYVKIGYSLFVAEDVRLEIYNSQGHLISTLADEMQPAGNYEITWNPVNQPEGIYFCRITTKNYSECSKISYIR